VDRIEADVHCCREYAESSASVVTPLNRHIGYEEDAKVAEQSLAERRTCGRSCRRAATSTAATSRARSSTRHSTC